MIETDLIFFTENGSSPGARKLKNLENLAFHSIFQKYELRSRNSRNLLKLNENKQKQSEVEQVARNLSVFIRKQFLFFLVPNTKIQ